MRVDECSTPARFEWIADDGEGAHCAGAECPRRGQPDRRPAEAHALALQRVAGLIDMTRIELSLPVAGC